jgi:hypothetical protein
MARVFNMSKELRQLKIRGHKAIPPLGELPN